MNTNDVYITGEAYGLAQVNSSVITSFQVGQEVCMFNSYPTTKYEILHDRALN